MQPEGLCPNLRPITDYLGAAGVGLASPYAGDSLQSLLDVLVLILRESPELQFPSGHRDVRAADHICMLDVLFEMRDPGTGYGIVKSGYLFGDQRAGEAYKGHLAEFVSGRKAILLHPWFRAGLPLPAEARAGIAPDQELTNASLTAFVGGLRESFDGAWSAADSAILDGVLSATRGDQAPRPEVRPGQPHSGLITDATNARIDRHLTDLSFRAELGQRDLRQLWAELSGQILQDGAIVSAASEPIHTYIGIPFGFRDPSSPAKFSLVASIFLGVDAHLAEQERLSALVRTIAIYLYRTSAPIIAQQSAMTSAQSAWAHEIKHIGAAIQGNWLVPVTQLFDVTDEAGKVIEGDRHSLAGPPRHGPPAGHLVLKPGYEDLATELDVTIYGRSMRSVGGYLQFSAALDDTEDDMPDSGQEDLLRNALDQAFSSLLPKVYMEMRPSVSTLREDLLLNLAVHHFCDLLVWQTRIWIDGRLSLTLRNLPWHKALTPLMRPVTPARFVSVLAAMLRNVLQHGNLRQPIIIRLDYDEARDLAALTVENAASDHKTLRRDQVDEGWLRLLAETPAVLDTLTTEAQASPAEWAELFGTVDVSVKGKAAATNREDTKSEAVVRFYLRNYAGTFSAEETAGAETESYVQTANFKVDCSPKMNE